MPLLTFDVLKGRSTAQLKSMLDAAHEAILEAFEVPVRDRYQIINEHDPSNLVVQDTGLGLARSDNQVLVRVFSRQRTREQKLKFYGLLATKIESACGIEPIDLVVTFVINTDEDWSFGLGQAQFLTGAL